VYTPARSTTDRPWGVVPASAASASIPKVAEPGGVAVSATAQFFADLAARTHVDALARTDGSIHFQLANDGRTEHWTVVIRDGDVAVSHSRPDRDVSCIVQCPLSAFDDIVTGDANAMTSVLRGETTAQGDLSVLMRFQRVFPAPPGNRRLRTVASAEGRSS
jgi:putative sterol carrier protein